MFGLPSTSAANRRGCFSQVLGHNHAARAQRAAMMLVPVAMDQTIIRIYGRDEIS
jgi:hypothetical protein